MVKPSQFVEEYYTEGSLKLFFKRLVTLVAGSAILGVYTYSNALGLQLLEVWTRFVAEINALNDRLIEGTLGWTADILYLAYAKALAAITGTGPVSYVLVIGIIVAVAAALGLFVQWGWSKIA